MAQLVEADAKHEPHVAPCRHRPGRRWLIVLAFAASLAGAVACSDNGNGAAATATAPPEITPPSELTVPRGLAACYISQHPGADLPPVRGYRLAATSPLPEGIAPSVKMVRFVGSGAARVLEAEICFAAEPSTAPGRHEARLELRLYNADAEKLSVNDRLQPIRTLPVIQALHVQ